MKHEKYKKTKGKSIANTAKSVKWWLVSNYALKAYVPFIRQYGRAPVTAISTTASRETPVTAAPDV